MCQSTPFLCETNPVSMWNKPRFYVKQPRFYVKQLCLHVDGPVSLWTDLYLWGQLPFLFRLDRIVSVWMALFQRKAIFLVFFCNVISWRVVGCHCLFKLQFILYFFSGTLITTNKTQSWRMKQHSIPPHKDKSLIKFFTGDATRIRINPY